MIPKVGLNQFASACADKIDTGIAGTGTTAPALTDTALETPVVATEVTAITTLGVSSFQVNHTILSTVAAPNSFTEWGILTSADVLLSRAVTAPVSHTSNDEITKLTTFNLVNK